MPIFDLEPFGMLSVPRIPPFYFLKVLLDGWHFRERVGLPAFFAQL
jgi:hypothetical protein